MTDERGAVIVGAGAAGHSCARTLRDEGFDGRIRLVNGEGGAPINRTLVNKGILPGLLTAEQIALPPLNGVEVVAGRAVSLRPENREVTLESGEVLRGEAIVLACGSEPRGIDPELHADPVVSVYALHDAGDAERLRAAVPDPEGRRIAVLGAGFIGTETATYFAGLGAEVLLVGRSELPLRAAVGSAVASRLAQLHRARVDARMGADVVAIRAGGAPGGAIIDLGDGETLEADAVIVALGTEPETHWAGLPDGVPVDGGLRLAEAPGVYAAGSAAVLDIAGSRLRIDHWDDAVAQGAHAARSLLHDLGAGADPGPYLPRAGFTLMAYGTAIAGRGAPLPGSTERIRSVEEAEGAGVLAEFIASDGRLCGIAGFAAGSAVARESERLFAEGP